MSDVMLDYGEPAEGEFERERNQSEKRRVDMETDAEMQDWADRYEGDAGDFEQQKERKMEELQRARTAGPKFYPLPREEGVSAGANRGVTSLTADAASSEIDLQGPEEETTQPDLPAPIGAGQDVRYSVLHLAGSPVTQCSTSRLFAYLTHYGAQPLGLEWVNDSSCNVVFSDATSARLAIEYLCPAVSTSYAPLVPLPTDQTLEEAVAKKKALDEPDSMAAEKADAVSNEWDSTFIQSLLFPRKAHRIPAKLYNAPERDAAAEYQQDQNNMTGQSSLPEDVPEIYREMEAEERQKKLMKPEQVNLQKLRGSLWLRWALESLDVKPSRAAKQSKWYREHGNDAGKEVVTKLLDIGRNDEKLELLPSSTTNVAAGGLPSRPQSGREQFLERGRGGRKAAMDDLDADLDSWAGAREEGLGYEESRYREEYPRGREHGAGGGGGGDRRRGGRREHRGRPTLDSLDEELEQSRRDRSASPARLRNAANGGGPAGTARVKGRGRMKAPSAWDDVDRTSDLSHAQYGAQRRRGGGPHQTNMPANNATLEQRLSQSLEQRINGGRDLLDRMS